MPSSRQLRYLLADDIWAMNQDILAHDGVSSVLRDRGSLEGALARAQTAAYYEQADIVTQAALLIAGLAQSHPFLDGNKRTAAAAGVVFLGINGFRVAISREDDTFGRQILALVNYPDSQHAAVQRFIEWLRPLVAPKS